LLIKKLYRYDLKNHLNPQKGPDKIYEVVVYVFYDFGQTGSSSKGPHTYSFKSPGARIFSIKISMFLTEMKLQLLKEANLFFIYLNFYTSKRPKDSWLK
jgi:hypothetical protein